MQEIEAKKQLKASEGAHFFYTLIFLSASGIIKVKKIIIFFCVQHFEDNITITQINTKNIILYFFQYLSITFIIHTQLVSNQQQFKVNFIIDFTYTQHNNNKNSNTQFIEQKCNQNLQLFVHLVFYGLIIWGTYILITLIPRYKNAAINLFFNFLDICFGIYIALLLFFGGRMYTATNDCQAEAPVLYFFLETFLLVIEKYIQIDYNGIIFAILFLAFVSYILKRFSKSQQVYEEGKDEFYDA